MTTNKCESRAANFDKLDYLTICLIKPFSFGTESRYMVGFNYFPFAFFGKVRKPTTFELH